MDVRTRLALVLVSVSLLSMFALGSFAYQAASSLLREVSERQLDALAESKQDALEKVIDGWRERVRLVRSRTRLRTLVDEHSAGRTDEAVAEMDRIISDALDSSSSLLRVAIFDARGELITSTGSLDLPLEMDVEVFSEPEAVLFGGTHVLSDGRVVVLFHTAMTLAGETIGALEATLDTEDIRTVTTDYTGLGRSGETQLFMSYQDELLMLSPLRHDPELQRVPARRSAHLVQILAGEEPVQRSRIVDYRGTEVWAATRLLEQVGWGLVVKIDLAEEAQRALRLRDEMLDVGLALSAIAILGGILLGFHLGRPLRELNEVVKRVRAGEDELRANVGSRDEVGFLGEALNELLDERQDRL